MRKNKMKVHFDTELEGKRVCGDGAVVCESSREYLVEITEAQPADFTGFRHWIKREDCTQEKVR